MKKKIVRCRWCESEVEQDEWNEKKEYCSEACEESEKYATDNQQIWNMYLEGD